MVSAKAIEFKTYKKGGMIGKEGRKQQAERSKKNDRFGVES